MGERRGAEAFAEGAEGSWNRLSEDVIGAAIEVHRHVGPGLLESAYELCLCHELHLRQIPFERQVRMEVGYKGITLERGFRLDVVVDERLVVELKAVELLTDLHHVQLLTYLRLSKRPLGLLINFNVPVLWKGVRRVVNNL